HLHRFGLVPLLAGDLAEVEENLAFGDGRSTVEFLQEKGAVCFLGSVEIADVDRQGPQIAQNGYGSRVDLESLIELGQSARLVAVGEVGARKTLMHPGQLLGALSGEGRDGLFQRRGRFPRSA